MQMISTDCEKRRRELANRRRCGLSYGSLGSVLCPRASVERLLVPADVACLSLNRDPPPPLPMIH